MRTPVILVIDDAADARETTCAQLASCNYEVKVASGPADARASIAENVPDAILLDIVMPSGDGIEFCTELRRMPGLVHAPIVLATAIDCRRSATRGLEAGASAFLTKPIYGPELRARLANLLAEKFYREDIEKRCAEAIKQLAASRNSSPSVDVDLQSLDEISSALGLAIDRVDTLRNVENFADGTSQLPIRAGNPTRRRASPLTNREREILSKIASGLSSRSISEALGIAVRTVEAHRARISVKLDIRTIAGLTRYAIKNGLDQ